MGQHRTPDHSATTPTFGRRALLAVALLVVVVVGLMVLRARLAPQPLNGSNPIVDAGPVQVTPTDQLSAADEHRRTLTVVVVDDAAQPIRGARVCLLVIGRELPAQRCALTDGDGLAETSTIRNGERWRVAVSAEGFRPATIPRLGELEPRSDQVRVMLRRGGVRLSGVVEDATGGIIENAIVTVEDASGAAMAMGRSGTTGEFELWANVGQVVVKAAADGYVASRERLVLPSGAVRLRLLPESVIAGRVLDADSGEPIADALVTGRRADDDGRSRLDDASFTTRSGEDGSYELRELPPGTFGLSSEGAWGFGASEGSVLVEFGGRTEDVDLLIHRGTALRIRVVIADTNQGCPGAGVELLDEVSGHRQAAITDPDGRVTLSVPIAGRYRIGVTCAGHRLVGETPIVELSGKSGESETVDIAVAIGLVARGRVVAETDGRPIAEAVVGLIPAHGRAPAAVGITDSEGRVALSGLAPGEYVATATAPNWFASEATVNVTVPSAAEFEFALRVGGSLVGSVVETSGAPVQSAHVLAHRRAVNGRWRGETIVDSQGRYEFAALPPGSYRIDVLGAGGQPLVTAEGDAASAAVDIRSDAITPRDFVVAPQDGVITGTVVDRDGGPLSAAFVCAEPDQPPPDAMVRRRCAPRMTDIDGRFEIRRLAQGEFTLRAQVRGGGEASRAGVSPGQAIELVVGGTGTLQGTAHYRSDGSAPDLLVVELVAVRPGDPGSRRRDVFVRTRGEWSIEGLPVGDYHVRIKAGRGAGAAEVEVGDGITRVGEVSLDDLTSLAGRVVVLETGEPIQGFRVVATALDAQLRSRYSHDDGRNVSDENGRFLVSDPPSGRVTLHVIPENLDARPPDLTEAHVTVTVNPGAPLDVGDVAVPSRRLGPNQARATFGFKLDRWDHVGDQAERDATVITVDPSGPAARAGLRVGDVITEIDGYEIVGRRYILQYLLAAPVGTTITLSTERMPGLAVLGQ